MSYFPLEQKLHVWTFNDETNLHPIIRLYPGNLGLSDTLVHVKITTVQLVDQLDMCMWARASRDGSLVRQLAFLNRIGGAWPRARRGKRRRGKRHRRRGATGRVMADHLALIPFPMGA